MIKVGVFGATGYTGSELVNILLKHPEVEITFATSQTYAGKRMDDVYPAGPELDLVPADSAPLSRTDAVFLCLPHAAAAETAIRALTSGNRVIDLSADFRLRDPGTYAKWYGRCHPAPELLETAVYGLTEFARQDLPLAQLTATPGCYPTSILLPLHPLLNSGIRLAAPIIADSKSGVSGAGRAPKLGNHFVEVAGNFSPYKIGRSHRHLPEMEQAMAGWRDDPPQLVFSPHLLPVPRGILSTIYVPLAEAVRETELHDMYSQAYDSEPFVRVLPANQLATLAHVTYSNRCVISLTLVEQTLILTSALDNLVKGAAGQAVQNMNAMFEIDESAGLS
jgi:N-acetyl-gamma-glutamyl-phosphate reductase